MEGVVMRVCEEADQKVVTELIVGVICEYFERGPINKEDYDNFGKFYRERGGVFYVAELNGEVIGTIAIQKEAAGVAHLRRMYLKRGYRRQGIGKQLYDEAVEFCRKKRYSKITLFTYPEMKEAIAFYTKEGFVEFKREGDKIFFEKSLDL